MSAKRRKDHAQLVVLNKLKTLSRKPCLAHARWLTKEEMVATINAGVYWKEKL